MLTASTHDLNLAEVHMSEADPTKRVRVNFPINKTAGSADSAVVYFEVAPGDTLAMHTDSEEEVLYIVAGEADATVGDETGRVGAGDLAVIPALVPHGLVNTGDETVKVVGFFSGAEITSVFAEPVQPVGASTLVQAPIPA